MWHAERGKARMEATRGGGIAGPRVCGMIRDRAAPPHTATSAPMTLDLWLLYLLAAVGLSLTPGPNGLLSLTHGACFGLRATVWTVLGGAVGFFLMIAVSLAGMGTLPAASERASAVAA